MKYKRLFNAVRDLSEVVNSLINLSPNYSQEISNQMSRALTSINKAIERKPRDPKEHSVDWYKNEISKILKLTPCGKDYDGNSYWRTYEKRWYVEIYEKLRI